MSELLERAELARIGVTEQLDAGGNKAAAVEEARFNDIEPNVLLDIYDIMDLARNENAPALERLEAIQSWLNPNLANTPEAEKVGELIKRTQQKARKTKPKAKQAPSKLAAMQRRAPAPKKTKSNPQKTSASKQYSAAFLKAIGRIFYAGQSEKSTAHFIKAKALLSSALSGALGNPKKPSGNVFIDFIKSASRFVFHGTHGIVNGLSGLRMMMPGVVLPLYAFNIGTSYASIHQENPVFSSQVELMQAYQKHAPGMITDSDICDTALANPDQFDPLRFAFQQNAIEAGMSQHSQLFDLAFQAAMNQGEFSGRAVDPRHLFTLIASETAFRDIVPNDGDARAYIQLKPTTQYEVFYAHYQNTPTYHRIKSKIEDGTATLQEREFYISLTTEMENYNGNANYAREISNIHNQIAPRNLGRGESYKLTGGNMTPEAGYFLTQRYQVFVMEVYAEYMAVEYPELLMTKNANGEYEPEQDYEKFIDNYMPFHFTHFAGKAGAGSMMHMTANERRASIGLTEISKIKPELKQLYTNTNNSYLLNRLTSMSEYWGYRVAASNAGLINKNMTFGEARDSFENYVGRRAKVSFPLFDGADTSFLDACIIDPDHAEKMMAKRTTHYKEFTKAAEHYVTNPMKTIFSAKFPNQETQAAEPI